MPVSSVQILKFSSCLFIINFGADFIPPNSVVKMKTFSSTGIKPQISCSLVASHVSNLNNIQHPIISLLIEALNKPAEEMHIKEKRKYQMASYTKGQENLRNDARKISNKGASQTLIVGNVDHRERQIKV